MAQAQGQSTFSMHRGCRDAHGGMLFPTTIPKECNMFVVCQIGLCIPHLLARISNDVDTHA